MPWDNDSDNEYADYSEPDSDSEESSIHVEQDLSRVRHSRHHHEDGELELDGGSEGQEPMTLAWQQLMRLNYHDADSDKNSFESEDSDSEDDMFFYELVTFRVEDRLFRVPPAKLKQQSRVFRDMFRFAQPEKAKCSDDEPIELEQVSKEAFRDLLGFLYPNKAVRGTKNAVVQGSPSFDFICICEWDRDRILAVLELANRWEFKSIRKILIKKLNTTKFIPLYSNPIDDVLAVQKYRLTYRFVRSYKMLAKRGAPLTSKERQRLGYPFADAMAAVRERHLKREMEMYRERTLAVWFMKKRRPHSVFSTPPDEVDAYRSSRMEKLDFVEAEWPPRSDEEEEEKLTTDIMETFHLPESKSKPNPKLTQHRHRYRRTYKATDVPCSCYKV